MKMKNQKAVLTEIQEGIFTVSCNNTKKNCHRHILQIPIQDKFRGMSMNISGYPCSSACFQFQDDGKEISCAETGMTYDVDRREMMPRTQFKKPLIQ
jgi:hypothetical protein